ncbi:hypothetical protein FACS1894216_18130 [Synergistales bacterium]|nr:hypothetical protein FACS1894216_18130 [Synergistales bacterium]
MIYLDCSYIYREHKTHTGIQRVTRSIAREESFTWLTWRESAEILLREISLRASENLSSRGGSADIADIFSFPGSDREN